MAADIGQWRKWSCEENGDVRKMEQWGKWLDYLVNRLLSLTVNTKKAVKFPVIAIAQCQVKLGKSLYTNQWSVFQYLGTEKYRFILWILIFFYRDDTDIDTEANYPEFYTDILKNTSIFQYQNDCLKPLKRD